MDFNFDGHVSYDELTEYIDGIGGGRKTGGADVTFAKALMKHFDDLDKSGEGDLSKKEVKAALRYCIEQFGTDRCMFASIFPVDLSPDEVRVRAARSGVLC